jgi:hypothetical protein
MMIVVVAYRMCAREPAIVAARLTFGSPTGMEIQPRGVPQMSESENREKLVSAVLRYSAKVGPRESLLLQGRAALLRMYRKKLLYLVCQP